MAAQILIPLISHLTSLLSSSVILVVSPPPEAVRALDHEIRSDLQSFAGSYLFWLIASSGIVALGVAMEGPEIIHDVAKALRRCFRKQKNHREREAAPWITLLGAVGWLLIVFGVVGEGWFEFRQNQAEGLLGTFNEIILSDAQRESAEATERASDANERATENESEARKLEKDTESEKLKAARLSIDLADAGKALEAEKLERIKVETVLGPRWLTVDQQKAIGRACAGLYLYGPRKRIQISSYGQDGEGAALATQIGAALNSVPLYTSLNIGGLIVSGGFDTGVIISAEPEDESFADCLKSALTDIGKLTEVEVNPARHRAGASISGGVVMSGGVTMSGGGGGLTPAEPLKPGSPVEVFVAIKPIQTINAQK